MIKNIWKDNNNVEFKFNSFRAEGYKSGWGTNTILKLHTTADYSGNTFVNIFTKNVGVDGHVDSPNLNMISISTSDDGSSQDTTASEFASDIYFMPILHSNGYYGVNGEWEQVSKWYKFVKAPNTSRRKQHTTHLGLLIETMYTASIGATRHNYHLENLEFSTGLGAYANFSFNGSNLLYSCTSGNSLSLYDNELPDGLYNLSGTKVLSLTANNGLSGSIPVSSAGKTYYYFGAPSNSLSIGEPNAPAVLVDRIGWSETSYNDALTSTYNERNDTSISYSSKSNNHIIWGSRIVVNAIKKPTPNVTIGTSNSGKSYYLDISSRVSGLTSHDFIITIDGVRLHPPRENDNDNENFHSNTGSYRFDIPVQYTFGPHTYSVKEDFSTEVPRTDVKELIFAPTSTVTSNVGKQIVIADTATANVYLESDFVYLSTNAVPLAPSISIYNYDDPEVNTYFQDAVKRPDSVYIRINETNNCNKLEYEISNAGNPSWSTTTVKSSISNGYTFQLNNLSMGLVLYARGYYDNVASTQYTSDSLNTSALDRPRNLSVEQTAVNGLTITWSHSYAGEVLQRQFVVKDGSTTLATLDGNRLSYIATGLAQGTHRIRVSARYINENNPNAAEYDSSSSSQVSRTLEKLPTPELTKYDISGTLYLVDQTNNSWDYIRDDNDNPIPITKNGVVQTGIIGTSFRLTESPYSGGVEYYFYDQLGSMTPVEDNQGVTNIKTIGLNKGSYGYVGEHHIYGKLHFIDDSSYDSDDSNVIDYTIGSLKTPTINWANLLTNPEGRILPVEYSLLDNLNMNKSYFDTGYAATEDTKVEGSFEFVNYTTSDAYLFGAKDTNIKMYEAIQNDTGTITLKYERVSGTIPTGFISNDKRSDLYFGRDYYIEYRNTTTGIYPTYSSNFDESIQFSMTKTLYIGALNEDTILPSPADIKISHLMIYENTDLMRNYLPAKRLSDDAVGFYDLVNNTFIEVPNAIAGNTSDQYSKKYESRLVWEPITEDTNNIAVDASKVFYYIDAQQDEAGIGEPYTKFQPDDLDSRIGIFIPDTRIIDNMEDPEPYNATIRVRAAHYNSWYIGGSAPATINYTILRPGDVENFDWDPDTTTFSWDAATNANTYEIYEVPDGGGRVLIQTIHDNKTEYSYPEVSSGLHSFYCLALNKTEERKI